MTDLQKIQLDIMIAIDKLCKDNGVVYYLAGGTAIGAVRHKGFIPWDDDLDIFITVDEYRKLKSAFEKSHLTGLVLQENYVNGEYWIYSKIRVEGTTQIEREEDKNSVKMQGVFIDVFPIRKCSSSHLKQKIQYLFSQYLTLMSLLELGWKNANKHQQHIISMIKLLPKNFIFNKAVNYIRKAEELTGDYCYSYFEIGRGIPMEKLVYNASVFGKPFYTQFENTLLPLPTGYNDYLSQFYGDYMTPPPEDQRKQFKHGILVDPQKGYREYLNGARGTIVQDMKWIEYYP